MTRVVGSAVVVAGILMLAGCGGGNDSESVFYPPPKTTGTLSEETARRLVVQDATALRAALESGDVDLSDVYNLINSASAEKDIQKSANRLRVAVPPLVTRVLASFPQVRAKVKRVRLRTKGGELFRTFGLLTLDSNAPLLRSLRHQIATSKDAWEAVARWSRLNEASSKRLAKRFDKMFRLVPADQRQALYKAVAEIYGS